VGSHGEAAIPLPSARCQDEVCRAITGPPNRVFPACSILGLSSADIYFLYKGTEHIRATNDEKISK